MSNIYTPEDLTILYGDLYDVYGYKFSELSQVIWRKSILPNKSLTVSDKVHGSLMRVVFDMPLIDIPLYINHKNDRGILSKEALIARWRLKIGR